MYWIPIVVLVVLAVIAVGWSPLFALIVAVPAVIAFGIYGLTRPRSDEQVRPPRGGGARHEDEGGGGAWGQRPH